jgi:hypothetical protein
MIQTHLHTSYDQAELKLGCNSDASTLKGNPAATREFQTAIK